MRIGRVERRHDLGVIPARLAIAEELDPPELEFGGAGLWERHEVARRFEDHKTLIHPELGQQRFTV